MSSLLSYSFVMPPTIFIVLALVGSLLGLRWRRVGALLSFVSAASLYVLATPAVSGLLLHAVAVQASDGVDDIGRAQAIVVLGGDMRHGDGSTVPDDVGPLTLERLRRAAALYRMRPLPVAVTGGPIADSRLPLARLMQEVLAREFDVPVRWREEHARNTFENAKLSAEMLRADGIHTVIVVTQPWHMRRALWAFRRVGLRPIPGPTYRTGDGNPMVLGDLFPRPEALLRSFYALHETLGLLYYRLRYA